MGKRITIGIERGKREADRRRFDWLDRKIGSGRATRAQVVEAIDLKRRISAAKRAANAES